MRIRLSTSQILTCFGIGYMRPAPGSWASLVAMVLGEIIHGLFGLIPFLLILATVGYYGWKACQKSSHVFEVPDDSRVVIDEVVGQWLAMGIILIYTDLTLVTFFACFLVFRFFDVVKPWPISIVDKRMKNATGVMLDDILAGVITGAIMTGALYAGIT